MRRLRTSAVALAAAFLLVPAAQSATPQTDWATAVVSDGVSAENGSAGVAVLPDGSAITAGFFEVDARFGPTLSLSSGYTGASASTSLYVAKSDRAGTWQWAAKAVGSTEDLAVDVQAVTPLSDGSAIVTGIFAGEDVGGTVAFGDLPPLELGSYLQGEVFVARVGSDGRWLWATKAVGIGVGAYALGTSAATASDDSVTVVGFFSDSLQFPGVGTLDATGVCDTFVATIGPDGVWRSAAQASGPSCAEAKAVTVLADGSSLVAGSFEGTETFGAFSVTAVESHPNVFVARLGPDGAWRSALSVDVRQTSFFLHGLGIDAFPDGSAILGGTFLGDATIGGQLLEGAGVTNGFVARLGANGTWQWATGVIPELGTCGGCTPLADVSSVDARADGSAVVVGRAGPQATFGQHVLSSSVGGFGFVGQIGADGTWAGATGAYGNVETLEGGGALPDGSITAAGTFGGAVQIGDRSISSGQAPAGTLVWQLVGSALAPSAPTATAGDASATVSWPALGAAITSYVVTASPGGATCTAIAPATSCVVFGLTNKTAYTFTVRAVNAAGTGPASTASNTVTPLAVNAFQVIRMKRSGPYAFVERLRVPEAGVATLRATYAVSGSRARRLACQARGVAADAGVIALRCRVNAAARRALKVRPLRLQVRMVFTPTGGDAARKTRTVVMPRLAPGPSPVTG